MAINVKDKLVTVESLGIAYSTEQGARQEADQALSTRIDNIVAPDGDPSLTEVSDARVSGSTTHNTLKARLDADQAAVGTEIAEIKADLTLSNTALFGNVDDTFPLSFENGTYRLTSVGSTLEKYNGGGYDKTRKVVKSTVFNAPCNVSIKAKTGYSFTVFTAENGVITASSGLVTEYSMIPNQQYGITLRTTGGSDDISETPVSSIVEIEYVANVDAETSNIKTDLEVLHKPVNIGDTVLSSGQITYNTGDIGTSSSVKHTDYIDLTGISTIIYSRIYTTSTATTAGVAFYDENKNYLEGQRAATGQSSSSYEPAIFAVREDAKYARFSVAGFLTGFFVYDYDEYLKYLPLRLDELEKNTDLCIAKNINIDRLLSGIINTSSGGVSTSTSGLCTNYIEVGDCTDIYYTRICTQNSSASYGCAFYDESKTFIPNSSQGPVLSSPELGYVLEKLTVPSGAKYARFTWMISLGHDTFAVYDASQYENTMEYEIARLETYHPDYSGKKLSILGDSISTFADVSEKTDGKAAEGCTTNYPGNPVQYSNSNVTSVSLTWWGQVLDHFGMTLGINESWAGSTIGYNPEQTASGKYTADNCLCSSARIGHLGDNGTPDLIIVFGGTNDINHHRVSSGSTLRYPVGELDSEHNPYDYDNFPMITETYYGSITTMLLRIQHTYPNATILMLLPYFCTYTHTSSGDRATPYDQNEWCKAAIDVCNYLGVEYLDLRSIINLYDVSSLLFDGLHPKANGMEAIAKAVIHKLNSML